MNTATTKKTLEVSEVIKDITLEGITALRAIKSTTTFEVVRESYPGFKKIVSKTLIEEKEEVLHFPLIEVTQQMLTYYRSENISSFVLKIDGKFYYTSIPNNLNFVDSKSLGKHKCSSSGYLCNRLSAASDKEGGCQKVRNKSKYIEKYPWIKIGYETFGTKHDVFVVVKCEHYENCPPSKSYTPTELNSLRLGLAHFVWDDVITIDDVRRRRRKNRK